MNKVNETITTMLEHRSIRKFKKEAVSKDDLNLILRAACNGSTMGNMQLYSIVVTEDKEMMKQMAPFHFNQPIATNAPLILTFCADFNRFNQYCANRGAAVDAYDNIQGYHWAFTDAIIAAQNACVAAESLNLGLCWLGTIIYNTDKFIDVLKLPRNVVPVACIAIGHPDETPELTDKLPVEAMIHFETYKNYNADNINALFAEKEQHPNTLKLIEENQLPNIARIITENRYKKADNEHFSNVLLNVLRSQGFLK